MASSNAVFLCALHHLSRWMYSGLDELRIVSGKCDCINVIPVHTIINNMANSVVDVLPAVHVLTGCDITTKVGAKPTVFQVVMKCSYELLHLFGKSETSDQMIMSAEMFLVECISKSSERNNFDD